jgi:hypothetical protein
MQQMLRSNEYDLEIQCNYHGMGVAYNKNFITAKQSFAQPKL